MKRTGRAQWLCLCFLLSVSFTVACSGPTQPDGATDVHVAQDVAADGPTLCVVDNDCSDQVFCNGDERCMPGSAAADARGCIPPVRAACTAAETCDEANTRCTTSCADADGDGHHDVSCGGDDCDDNDVHRFPGNPETCDGAGHDEDCDPCTIAGADGDTDHDTYAGNGCFNRYNGPPPACDPNLTRVVGATREVTGSDCDDTNANVHPNQSESCNGVDDNCDGVIDEAAMQTMFYPDCDGDHFGLAGSTAVVGCTAPSTPPASCPGGAWAPDNTDCNDTNEAINPGNPDICNGVDDNCNGTTDEGGLMHPDVDNDGRGNPAVTMMHACSAGWVFNGDDCDDSRAETYGGSTPAREMCDGLDNDCSLPGAMAGGPDTTEDADGDHHSPVSAICLGRGDPGAIGSAFPRDDCDDTAATTFTGAFEICGDGVDQDCNGVIDDPTQVICTDADGDGHGDPSTRHSIMTCTIPAGSVPNPMCDDCNDSQSTAFPGNREICDRVDNDCSTGGGAALDEDADSDRYAPASATCAGLGEAGAPSTALPRSDCDDTNANVHPGAAEICDRIDSDCSSGGGVALDEDADNDGHAPVGAACLGRGEAGAPSTAFAEDDCDDSRPTVHGGRTASDDTSTCDGIDNDCNQSTSEETLRCVGGGLCAPGGVCTRAIGIREIAAGREHTCVRMTDGSARCWGRNSEGQLGDGTLSARTTPTPVLNLVGAVEIAAGEFHTCARMNDGAVRCWGYNAEGQLGDGTATAHATPTLVSGLVAGVAEIALGRNHTCARMSDGTVRCWGLNLYGQIGDGTSANRPIPTLVPGLSGVVEIAADGNHTCARLLDSTVRCWGYGPFGQIGDGTGASRSTPTVVSGLSGAAELELGANHSCARLNDGTVRCWGDNGFGQLGDGTMTNRYIATAVPGLSGVAELAVGYAHTCVRMTDGTARCWGHNDSGQLGDNTTTNHATPAAVLGLSGAVEIAAGFDHTCARWSDNTVRCWGNNSAGQIGDGSTTSRSAPTMVLGIVTSTAGLAGGGAHTCARMADGSAMCWGYNASGQVGDGSLANRVSPVRVPALSSVAEIATGGNHSCVRLNDNTVRCWGNNGSGALGDGTLTNRTSPTPVTGLTSVTQLALGLAHSCALIMDGTVRCWGYNGDGELGDASTTSRSTPIAVPGLAGVVEIAAGLSHTCARLNTDSVRCWGRNDVGQLGDGTTTNRTSPTTVSSLSGVAEIAAGQTHTCARMNDGSVRCWGDNYYAQLGDGTAINRPTPNPVPGLSGVVEIATGERHVWVRMSDGTVRGWGDNNQGQLGDGSTSIRRSPTPVPSLSAVVEVTAGGNHACARSSDGAVRCTGVNTYGQLGDGTMTNRSTPFLVPEL